MYKLKFLPCAMALFFIFPATAQEQQTAKLGKNGTKPPNGYVPDAPTAVKIAGAVLIPVYGEQKILRAPAQGNVGRACLDRRRYAVLRRRQIGNV